MATRSMIHGSSIRTWVRGGLLVLVGTGVATDLSRPQCERAVLALPGIVALVSDRAADALFAKLATVEASEPVRLIRVADARSFRFPRGTVGELWNQVQAGVFSPVPPLDAVLVGRPYWYSSAEDFFREVLAANPSAREWNAPAQGRWEYLLLQFGGGVEDLKLQVLLEASGRAWVWMLGPEEHSWLPAPATREIGGEIAARAFRLARGAGLPDRSASVWLCGALDGGVQSFTLVAEDGVGRIAYLNSQEPPEELSTLRQEIFGALGITRRGPWFSWQDGAAHTDGS